MSHLPSLFFLFVFQTHRELDGIADSERRRYGALHRTAETVSADAFIFWCVCVCVRAGGVCVCRAVCVCVCIKGGNTLLNAAPDMHSGYGKKTKQK